MKTKIVKRYVYEGLGFPIILLDVPFVQIRGVWTPAIKYEKLQREVLLALCHKPIPFSGNEIHFIRAYFEMTLEEFGKQFGVSHVAVLHWEKTKNRSAKISTTTELCVRLFILERLEMNNRVFRDTFREFTSQHIQKEQKISLAVMQKPLLLPSIQFAKKSTDLRV